MSLTFFFPLLEIFLSPLPFIMFTDFKCQDMLHILFIILSLHTAEPTYMMCDWGVFCNKFYKKFKKVTFFTKWHSIKNSWCLNQASIIVTDRLKNGWCASQKSPCIIYSVARSLACLSSIDCCCRANWPCKAIARKIWLIINYASSISFFSGVRKAVRQGSWLTNQLMVTDKYLRLNGWGEIGIAKISAQPSRWGHKNLNEKLLRISQHNKERRFIHKEPLFVLRKVFIVILWRSKNCCQKDQQEDWSTLLISIIIVFNQINSWPSFSFNQLFKNHFSSEWMHWMEN